MATLTLRNSTIIIPGMLVKKPRTPETLKAQGVSWTATPGVAVLRLGRKKVFLHGARIVVRQSGRKRHLSRYLVGTMNGILIEVFLGVVRGARNTLFRLKDAAQQAILNLFAKGMNPRQRIAALV